MSLNLFEARALAATVDFLDAHGYQSEPLLDRLGIPVEMMRQGGWVSINQFYRFAASTAQRVGCREAVLEAELAFFRLDHLGVISPALRSCKTVKETLELATRMACRGYQGCRYSLDIRGDTTWLSYSNPRLIPSADKFVDDITLGAYVHLMRAVIDENWQPQHLRIQEQDTERHRSLSVFENCRIDYDPLASGLAFPTEFLSRRVPWSTHAESFDESYVCEKMPEVDESFSDTLYRLLASLFPFDQIPNQNRTAKMIGVSPATLKRQLALTGMTYRRLVDRLRFDAASDMLSIPQMSIKEISSELGFSGTSNFVRSFRRMTGVTPAKYRRRQMVHTK
mgnify:FL=1